MDCSGVKGIITGGYTTMGLGGRLQVDVTVTEC